MRTGFALVATGWIIAAAACATTAPEDKEDVPPRFAGQGCDAAQAQSLVGQTASADLTAKAQGLSGAATVRWLRPGQIVTMEYRADRLNIQVDENNKVLAIRCG